jgi:aminoglycoside phosphotransferase family enzyme
MIRNEIDSLVLHGSFPDPCYLPKLIETHISWLVLCNNFAFKIKKPIHYSFLDFSTLQKRKFFCEREVELNRRTTPDMYIDVLPVMRSEGKFHVGRADGEVFDYAVRMKRMDNSKQMDVLVRENKIDRTDVINLALQVAAFHRDAITIYDKAVINLSAKFNDLTSEKEFLGHELGHFSNDIIGRAISQSDRFLKRNLDRLDQRMQSGLFRDCHGDLHTRNIFLLPQPVIFDCIEFNDSYRHIDVLNEVAFLCMDLDASERPDLAELFIKTYNSSFPVVTVPSDNALFIYYKCYRANVRVKVNALRAKSASDSASRRHAVAEAARYLHLMNQYMLTLDDLVVLN